jgi:ATP-dependent DNA ligase
VNLPLSGRRDALESLLAAPKDPLRLSPLLQAPSGEVLEAVCIHGLEGVVGKRTDSVYEPGERSDAWIKLRANMEQEFVIGGYIPGSRGFDALLVGVYEKEELIFVAKVKNGFVPRIRDEIFPTLKELQNRTVPVQESAREEGIALGRIANRREDGSMPVGQAEACLPSCVCRMEGCRTPAALHLRGHAR